MVESKIKNFNHLKIHTQYSICEGAIKIDDLKEFSKVYKIKSLGLSDTCMNCGAKIGNINNKNQVYKKPSERTIEVKAEEIK